MYTYTHHVQPKSAIRINVNYMYYSERWISGADSLRTSNISDHAHSDQFTSCVTILSSISTCNLMGVTGVVTWIRINGRSIPNSPCKIQFDWPLGQSNLLAYIVHCWCAPAVCVPKSSGEIRICVNFVQLNKVT